jgi:hypothetical protein
MYILYKVSKKTKKTKKQKNKKTKKQKNKKTKKQKNKSGVTTIFCCRNASFYFINSLYSI